MNPTNFPEANSKFGPPKDLAESQCQTIYAFQGEVKQGSIDGSHIVVTAWLPTKEELKQMNEGSPIFLFFMGGLPPHYVATSFQAVTNFA